MVTITEHVFINKTFLAVKFGMGYEKKYALSGDTKISKSLKKKVEKIGTGMKF